jgi:signal transduction histidine kinase
MAGSCGSVTLERVLLFAHTKFRNWLRNAPASARFNRNNTLAMQGILMAYAALQLGNWGWQLFDATVTTKALLSSIGDLLGTLSAMTAVVMIRLGRLRLATILFLSGLLGGMELAFLMHDGQPGPTDAQTTMILAVVVCGFMLKRRERWLALSVIALMLASELFTGHRDPGHLQAMYKVASSASLFLLIALMLKRRMRTLRHRLTRAASRQGELQRELDARLRAQAKLMQVRKMKVAEELASAIAHEFSNLLDLVLGYTTRREHVVWMSDVATQKAAFVRVLERVEGAALRGSAFTRKLLDFKRFEYAHPEAFNVTSALVDLQPLLRHLLSRTVELAFPVHSDAIHVYVDRGAFDLIVLTIASNARDAMPHGGRFSVRLSQEESFVRISFSDTGHGMTAEVRERMFDPFFSTKTSRGNAGIGLAIIRELLMASDGDIAAESELGNGTTLHIRLPAAADASDRNIPFGRRVAQRSPPTRPPGRDATST